MCGIIGIVGKKPVVDRLYDGLSLLQHRGQDAAGIATSHKGKLCRRKANGLVKDVFRQKHIDRLKGDVGIGHCRYPTAGSDSAAEAQPFYVNAPYGIVMVHNGNLVNSSTLAEEMFDSNLRHINTNSDSEILLNVFAHELQKRVSQTKVEPTQIFEAVGGLMERCDGGYAVTAIILDRGLVAFRDPNGIRPLVLGERETDRGTEYMVASESVALIGNDFKIMRDVEPGETIYVDGDGVLHAQVWSKAKPATPCIFEYVYLARPDSVLDDISVYQTRLRLGKKLAGQLNAQPWIDDVDVVIPIPSTGRNIALEVAAELELTYREGFIKNRYIGRTFIMPGQAERVASVKKKLSPMSQEFNGLNVLLIDDSIVRGTTSEQIVQMAKRSGANKVFFASAAPPVRHPNVYGIDTPTAGELLASGRDIEQMRKIIGCDELIFQHLDDMVDAVREGTDHIIEFEMSCFSGEYVTPGVTEDYLKTLETNRKR